MATVIALQGDTVDLLCWRHLGRTGGVTERVLARNPGLAELGPVLPLGTQVTLPDRPVSVPVRPLINLWD
ncbi:tail protein X [Chitinivorax sp. B]|uniref:tail protein X n=1 Tax=Chitinivorax sp. B TaxID=2502235 RepID=UPI0010F8F8F7|nr:tail protein X [Chitinivorax sp. B]